MREDITLLIGTTKGAFLLDGDAGRQGWRLRGPFCDGWPINHMAGDPETGTLWAGGGGPWHGAGVWRSEDGGESWHLTKLAGGKIDEWLRDNPQYAGENGPAAADPAPFTGECDSVWSLAFAHGTLYAGTRPAMLLASQDGGAQFEKIEGLSNHPSRESWIPGAAGLTLHSIVPAPADPAKLWVGISAAGVFATEDGGASWDRRNRRSNAGTSGRHVHPDGTVHETGPDVGSCVHNMVRAGGENDLIYQQNHQGVFRSPDGGRSWDEITAGLPSSFGFPIAVHPRDAATIWVLPLNGDTAGRYPPDASAAVWKSTDGGESWTAKQAGLPAENCFFTVLRQAMTTDGQDPAGVYFGTNTGSVFASADEGESWAEIAQHLPTVLCVEVLERA